MTGQIVILCTCGSAEEAARLAQLLVERRLTACVNVLPGIHSVYRWKDRIESGCEWLLLIKTARHLFADVSTLLQTEHSYEVPEVIAIPVVEGAASYLDWLRSSILPQPEVDL